MEFQRVLTLAGNNLNNQNLNKESLAETAQLEIMTNSIISCGSDEKYLDGQGDDINKLIQSIKTVDGLPKLDGNYNINLNQIKDNKKDLETIKINSTTLTVPISSFNNKEIIQNSIDYKHNRKIASEIIDHVISVACSSLVLYDEKLKSNYIDSDNSILQTKQICNIDRSLGSYNLHLFGNCDLKNNISTSDSEQDINDEYVIKMINHTPICTNSEYEVIACNKDERTMSDSELLLYIQNINSTTQINNKKKIIIPRNDSHSNTMSCITSLGRRNRIKEKSSKKSLSSIKTSTTWTRLKKLFNSWRFTSSITKNNENNN